MKRKALAIAIAPALIAASTVSAVTLTIDGAVQGDFEQLTIVQTDAGVEITTGSESTGGGDTGGGTTGGGTTGGGSTTTSNTGDGFTGGGDTGGDSACVESTDQECESLNWADPGGQQRLSLVGNDEVISFAFTTTGNSSLAGYLSIAHTTAYSDLTRRIWVSAEPNGQPIESRCEASGNGAQSILWIQRSYPTACSLQVNTPYYVNITHVENTSKPTANCRDSEACSFFFAVKGN